MYIIYYITYENHIKAVFSLSLSLWSSWSFYLCDGARCYHKSALHTTPQLSNHYISIHTGRLPHRQGTTSAVHRLSGVYQLITAHHRSLAQVRENSEYGRCWPPDTPGQGPVIPLVNSN